jgi:hypothetical protein
MFYPVIVMLESTAGVVGRINVDTLYLAGKFLFQGFEGEEVIAEDEAIVEDVVLAGAVWGVVAFSRVFQQDAGFEARAGFFADPG